MHALYRAFRDGAQDDAVLQTNRDDRILRHDNTHRNGGEHLSAVLDRTFLHHRDIDDHEKLLVLGIDTRAFLRVERRANKLFLNLSRLRDLLQLVRAGMHHVDPAALGELAHFCDAAVHRFEKFNHIIPPFSSGTPRKCHRE